MSELCNWFNFQAHQRRYDPEEETQPDFFGTFICPVSRKEPEELLGEVLTIRKVFLVQVTERRRVKRDAFWGMNERLKQQIDELGYGISLTKVQPRTAAYE
jgi:hypothetical protein